jgi:hypothetical protein
MSRALARATISTDWGGRALAAESDLYDPLHYNNGTVWPFVTGFLALAQYRYHNVYAARAALEALGRTFDVWGRGRNPEVFSGSSFTPLETAVPQQFFATSQYLNSLARGAFGLEADAPQGIMAVAPHLFTTPGTVHLTGVREGANTFDVRLDVRDTAIVIGVRRTSGRLPVTLQFAPALAPGARVREVVAGGRRVPYQVRDNGRDIHVVFQIAMAPGEAGTEVAIRHTAGWRIVVDEPAPESGDRSRQLKVLDARVQDGSLVLDLEGAAGRAYGLTVYRPGGPPRREVVGMPALGDPRDGYVHVTRRVRD